MTRRLVPLALVFLLAASSGRADSFSDIRRACIERGNFHQGIHWLEECVQEMFTAEPVHLTLTSVAPGAGIAAFGLGFGRPHRILHLDLITQGTAAVSSDGSYVGQAQTTFALPPLSFYKRDSDTTHSSLQKFGVHGLDRSLGQDELDAKASVTLGYRRIDARQQDFYGLGPNSTLPSASSYGLLLSDTYARINNPLTAWNTIGFNFSFLQPRVTSSINHAVPVIRSAFTDATAPGLASRDDFVRAEPYLLFRIPPRRSYYSTLRVGYAFYHDLAGPRLSFQRLSGVSTTLIPLWVPSKHTPSNRIPKILNVLCPGLHSAARCSLGDLTFIASVVASYKAASSQVPFYFDQTLGGTDINGNDTLRGYVDYRFRASSSILFQIEYRHPIWGPFGLLSFYDLGKVALLPSDISLDHLRHDIGVGLYFRAGGREIARVYFGFGTPEGSRLNPKFPVSF